MNKIHAFYDASTGLFLDRTFSVSADEHEEALKANTPNGHIAIEGRFDHLSQRIDIVTGQVVDWQPERSSPDHEWNATSRRWQLSTEAQAKASATAAARARHAELISQQQDDLRRAVLGDAAALERLRRIEEEVGQLPEHREL